LGQENHHIGVGRELIDRLLAGGAMVESGTVDVVHHQTGRFGGCWSPIIGSRIDHHPEMWLQVLGLKGLQKVMPTRPRIANRHQHHQSPSRRLWQDKGVVVGVV
jgi:hypothetical protein